MIDLNEVWPVGRLTDVQIRIKKEGGGIALIGALNDHQDGFDEFFDKIEIVRVGFQSKMEGGSGCEKHVFQDLLSDVQAYKSGDLYALDRMEQKLLSQVKDSIGG